MTRLERLLRAGIVTVTGLAAPITNGSVTTVGVEMLESAERSSFRGACKCGWRTRNARDRWSDALADAVTHYQAAHVVSASLAPSAPGFRRIWRPDENGLTRMLEMELTDRGWVRAACPCGAHGELHPDIPAATADAVRHDRYFRHFTGKVRDAERRDGPPGE